MIAAALAVTEWAMAGLFALAVIGGLTQDGAWFAIAVAALVGGFSARDLAASRARRERLAAPWLRGGAR